MMEVGTSTDVRDIQQDIANIDDSSSQGDAENNDAVDGVSSGFEEFMRSALGGAAKTEVNEEELFAGLIQQRLTEENPEAAEFFRTQQTGFLASLRRADGYVSVEEAAVRALEATVAAGKIDLAIAEQINGEAFAGAQLDDNKDALYDSNGSAEDDTVAVASMEAALLTMRTFNDGLEAGTLNVAPRSLDSPMTTSVGGGGGGGHGGGSSGPAPSGPQDIDGAQGFLWKPVSEGDGNLVVLLPTSFVGLLEKVEIHSDLPPTPESLIESGEFAGDTHNGGRSHWRFDQPGEAYGENVHVVAFKDDGTTASWDISSGGERHD